MCIDSEKIKKAVTMLIEAIGENPKREGLKDTPLRVAKMYKEFFAGYNDNVLDHIDVVFHENYHDIVFLKQIPFFSICEHHLIPFIGFANICYLPKDGCILGLSKIVRILHSVSKRLQLQERITATVADIIMENLKPQGVIVCLEAEHMCMAIRGVKSFGTKTITKAVKGIFSSNDVLRKEAFSFFKA